MTNKNTSNMFCRVYDNSATIANGYACVGFAINQMYVGLAISVIVTILRIVTTQPISEK